MNQIQKSIEANPNTLTHEPILNKYIDLEIDRCDEILPEDRWEDGCRSDIEIKQRCHNLAQDSVKRRNNDRAQESGVLQHAEIGLPVPRNEGSLKKKLSAKMQKRKRFKRN